MEIKTMRIVNSEPFKMYLLSDANAKKISREFSFYAVRFYREERCKILTVDFDYPKANVYWYVEFKRYVELNILSKDLAYADDWNKFFESLKKDIYTDYEAAKLPTLTDAAILNTMRLYNLRDYQAYDLLNLRWIMNKSVPHTGLILSEQRTGKTRIAVAMALNSITNGVVLVVCPKSAVQGWKSEFEDMMIYTGMDVFDISVISTVTKITHLENKDDSKTKVRIITYDLLKRLSKTQIKKILDFTKHNKTLIIGDEVHRLRNFKTQQSDALFTVKDMFKDYKDSLEIIGITGTPAVKDSYDVFGVLSFINFSKIGFNPYWKDFNDFKEYFYNCEDTSYGKVVRSIKRKAELSYLLKSTSVQTKQKDLKLFVNYAKKYIRVGLDMDDLQRDIYQSVLDTFEYKDEVDCKNTLSKYVKLQQICNDASTVVDSYKEVSPKIKWIVNFAKANKKQFIIMSKKLKTLKHLGVILDKHKITYSVLKGDLSYDIRQNEIDKFKSGASQIFIIQSDVGREALTLPEASYTIFIDRDFAQGYNEQAEARMTPVDGSKCTKYVIDLIMKDTIEEEIYDRLVIKKMNINDVNVLFEKVKEVKTEDVSRV